MKRILFLSIILFTHFSLFSQDNSFSISLSHPDLGVCDFEFYKYSTRSTDQQVFLWDGTNLTPQDPGPVRTYRGRVTNHPNYKVFAVWYPDSTLYIKALAGKGEKQGFKFTAVDLSTNTVTPLDLPIVTEPHVATRLLKSGYSCTYPDFINPEKGNSNYETMIAMWENGVNITDYFSTRDLGLSITTNLLVIPTDTSIQASSDIIHPSDYPSINKIEMFWKTTGSGGGAGRHNYCNQSFQGGRTSLFKGEFGALPHEFGHTLDMGHHLNQFDAMHSNQYFWGRNSVTIATAHLELPGNLCLSNPNSNYSDPLHPWTAEDYSITNENTPVDIDVLANDIDYNGDVISIKDFENPSNNGATISLQGNILHYEPKDGFIGRDTFFYTTESGTGSGYFTNEARVLVDVRDSLCPLALHYSFDEVSGTTVHDEAWSISSQNATLKNCDFSTNSIPGVVGKAIDLPSEIDGVILNDILDPIDRDLSISIWFKLYELPAVDQEIAIFDSGTRGSLTRVGTGIMVDTVGIHFQAQPETKDYDGAQLDYLDSLNTNQWYHAVMVIDRTTNTLRAYLNGVEVTHSETNNIDFEPSHLIKGYPGYIDENSAKSRAATTIGRECGKKANENKSVLKGAIDELKIYTKALTNTEVNILFTTPTNTTMVDECMTISSVRNVANKRAHKMSIHPNPSTDYIIISGITSDAPNYKIINTLGMEVLSGFISKHSEINIESLKAGIYFIKFDNGNIAKFVKN